MSRRKSKAFPKAPQKSVKAAATTSIETKSESATGETAVDSPPQMKERTAPFRWASLLAVLLGGVLLGLSQPLVTPWTGQDPVLPGISGLLAFVGFVPLFVVVRDAGPKRTYWMAFAAVFVQMWIILYWILIAMTVFGRISLLPSMIALSALSAAIAFGVAAPFAVAQVICRSFPLPYWAVASVAVTGLELIRNNGPFGGFPWGNVGNSLATIPLLAQGASLFGVYGLVFCIVVVNAAIAEGYVAFRQGRFEFSAPLRVAVAVLVTLVGWGAYRLATSEDTTAPTVRVALLQGNIEQGIKNDERKNRRQILDAFQTLQEQALKDGAEIVVWPEASLPVDVKTTTTSLRFRGVVEEPAPARKPTKPKARPKTAKAPVASSPPTENAPKIPGDAPPPPSGEKATPPPPRIPPAGIIGGTASFTTKDDTGKRRYRHYNTAFAVTKDLKIVGRFDKSHLVPFGEYIPWPVAGIVSQFVGTTSEPGDGLHPIALDVNGRTISVATTICYEGAFPEITRDLANEGAEVMFNVTNDAWYGISSMAHQHLALYSLRAIESGRAIARVANTGISAWIDSRGRVHDATPMYETTSVVADVPLVTGTTPFRVLGEWVAMPSMLVILLLWFIAITKPGRRPRAPLELGVTAIAFAQVAIAMLPLYAPSEKMMTIRTLVVIAGLLVGLGAYSGRPWGRRAQQIVGVVAAVLLTPGVVLGAPIALAFELFFVGAGIFARRRPDEYRVSVDGEQGSG